MTDHATKHPKLKPDWTAPAIPDGYSRMVVFIYSPDSEPELDFFSEDRMDFASENPDITLPRWPWASGFKPTRKDWEGIGFEYMQP